ncbi:MAG: PAS domain S-box protein [Psychroflexus sp.]
MADNLHLLWQVLKHIEIPAVIINADNQSIEKYNAAFSDLLEIEENSTASISLENILVKKQDLKHFSKAISTLFESEDRKNSFDIQIKGMVDTFKIYLELLGEKSEPVYLLARFEIQEENKKVNVNITRNFLEESQQTAKIGSWKYDFNTGVSTWSKTITEILGVNENHETDLNRALDFYKPGASKQKAEKAMRLAEEKGRDFDMECIVMDNAENEKWVRVTGNSHKNDRENYVIGTFQDISRQKKIEFEVQERNEFIHHILENLPIGIATNKIDTEETQFINQRFFEIYGWTLDDVHNISHFFEKVYPDPAYREKIQKQVLVDIASGDPKQMQWNGVEIMTKSGEKKIINAKNIPVYEQNLMISTVTDVTSSYRAEQELIKTKDRLYLATKASSDAIWDWHIGDDKIFWGEGYHRLFGYKTEDSYVTEAFWKSKIHPNDFKSYFESLNSAMLDTDIQKWTFNYRFQKSDGNYSFVKENVIFIRDEQNKNQRVVGAIQDISASRKRENHLSLLESVIANTKDAILVTKIEEDNQLDNVVIFANKSFAELTGYSVDEVIGKTLKLTYGSRTSKTVIQGLQDKLNAWEACNIEMINYTKHGKEFWNSLSFTPIADDNGWYTHWVCIQRDITSRKIREHQRELNAFTHKAFQKQENLHQILIEVLDEIYDTVGFTLGEIWLTSSNQDELYLFAKSERHNQILDFYETSADWKRFKKGQGLPGLILKNKKMQFWENINVSEDWIRKEAGEFVDLKDAFGFPIVEKDKVLGVVLLGFSHQHNPEKTLYNLFENFAINLGAEIRRKQSEDELNQFFDFAPDFMCIAGKNGYLKKVNAKAANILGYQEKDLLEKPFLDFIPTKNHQDIFEKILKLESEADNVYFESRLQKKTGEDLHIAWTISKSEETKYFYCVGKDISDKVELEQILQKTNQLASIGNWEVNFETGKTYWSDTAKSILNLPKGEQPKIKETLGLLHLENNTEYLLSKDESWIKNKLRHNFEKQITPKGKSPIWVRIFSDVECTNGLCNRVFGSIQNIHERKTAQLKQTKILKEKNEILESISEGFYAVDKNWKVTYWNTKAEELLGVSKVKIINKNLWDFFDENEAAEIKENYSEAFKTQNSVHFESYFEPLKAWFDVNAHPSKDILSVYFRDITEEKRIIDEIKASNEKFHRVSEATNDVIWDYDLVKDTITWSQGLKHLFGYELEEFGDQVESWSMRVHPEDRDQVLSSFETAFENPTQNFWRAEYRFKRKDGSYADVIDRGSIIRNQNNNPIRMVGSLQDISDSKVYQKSLEKLNLELEKRAKALEISNRDLEQFAYVASHDLQEPLRMVTSFLSRLEEKYESELDEKAKQYIFFAVDGAKRMRQIILDLLEFSRVGRNLGKIKRIDVNAVLKDVEVLLKEKLEATKTQITTENLPDIFCSEMEIKQILLNLIDNAVKYRKENQKPVIHIGYEELEDSFQFEISDNGIGIDALYYQKIFTIFRRLHPQDEYSGTGIGLAIAKKIVNNLGGEIWLKSDIDIGTTFYFTIPKKNIEIL